MLGLFFYLLFYFHHAAAEPGIFYNPPTGGAIHDYSENQVYNLGDTVQMRWATSLEYFSIMLWQNDNDQFEWIQTGLTGVTSYDWIVSTQRDLDHGNVFFFQIRDAANIDDQDRLFASHYFNITQDGSHSTTSASSTSPNLSTTPTLLPSTSSSIVPSATATSSSPADSHTSDAGLSSQTKVGVGVGVGLGCAFLAALALVVWYVYRRTARLRETPYVGGNAVALPKENRPEYTRQQAVPAEVHGESRRTMRFELPS